MSEEKVTLTIIEWLLNKGWEILTFDFPQSGTGKALHPNGFDSQKIKGSIIPDIVAIRGPICIFFENKDRLFVPDFIKMNKLITSDSHSEAINTLLANLLIAHIYYGIGLPTQSYNEKAKKYANLVDFIIGVNEDRTIAVLHETSNFNVFHA